MSPTSVPRPEPRHVAAPRTRAPRRTLLPLLATLALGCGDVKVDTASTNEGLAGTPPDVTGPECETDFDCFGRVQAQSPCFVSQCDAGNVPCGCSECERAAGIPCGDGTKRAMLDKCGSDGVCKGGGNIRLGGPQPP